MYMCLNDSELIRMHQKETVMAEFYYINNYQMESTLNNIPNLGSFSVSTSTIRSNSGLFTACLCQSVYVQES